MMNRGKPKISYKLILMLCILIFPFSVLVSAQRPIDHAFSDDGSGAIVFMNAAGSNIKVYPKDSYVENNGLRCGRITATETVVAAGDTFTLNVAAHPNCAMPGVDSYDFKVTLVHENQITGIIRSSTGRIWGPMDSSGAAANKITTTLKPQGKAEKEAGVDLTPVYVMITIICLATVFFYLKRHGKPKLNRKYIGYAVVIFLISFLSYTFYIYNLEHFTSEQQTLVFAHSKFISGSTASLRVIARESVNGNPIENTDIEVKITKGDLLNRYEKILYQGKTSDTGTVDVKFNVPEDIAPGEYRLIIKAGPDLIEKNVEIRRKAKILLTTDKPIYQPTQEIHIRALVLNPFNLKPYANENITLEVEDSKSNKVFKLITQTNDYGISSAEFTLADEVLTGRYTVRALTSLDEQEKKIKVEKYVLPKYRIDFETDSDFYLPSETLKGFLSAQYFFGKAVSNANVDVTVSAYEIDVKKHAHVTGKTDEFGNFDFEVKLPEYLVGLPLEKGNALLLLNVSVTDSTNHRETIVETVPVSKHPINIHIIPERNKLKVGMENTVYVVTTYPDQSPAKTTLTVNSKKGETNTLGVGSFKFTPSEGGNYKISVTARDKSGRASSKTEHLSTEAGGEQIIFHTDKPIYYVGDTSILNVYSSGSVGTKTAYVDVIKNKQTILTKALELEGGRGVVNLEITPDMIGNLEIHTYKILRSTDIVRDVKKVIVYMPRDLDIDVETDKEVYLPGEEAEISFRVSDEDGGVQSALGVNIVDESVYALKEIQPGFEKIYFLFEKEILEPRFQIKNVQLTEIIKPRKEEPGETPVIRPEIEVEEEDVARAYMASIEEVTDFDIMEDTFISKKNRIEDQKKDYTGKLYLVGIIILILILLAYPVLLIYGLVEIASGKNRIIQLLILAPMLGFILGIFLMFILIILVVFLQINVDHTTSTMIFGILQLYFMVIGIALLLVLIVTPLYGIYGICKWIRNRKRGVKGKTKEKAIGKKFLAVFFSVALLIIILSIVFFGAIVIWQLGVFKLGTSGSGSAGFWSETYDGASKQYPDTEEADTVGGATPYLRQFFPETLYSNPSLITDEEGKATIELKMADSITSWRLSAIASTLDGRLGGTDKGILVFQDFFIDVDLPRTLTQGDEVWVPVALYNYLDKPQDIRLELMEGYWFELMDEKEKTVRLNPSEVTVTYYHIKVLKHGPHKFTVYAYGTEKSDAISRQIEVVPDGEETYATTNGRLEGIIEEEVYIPEYSVDDASKILVKIYPGYFSQVVDGLDNIFRVPHGCFEQTTSITYPNVLILDYMKRTEQITPELQMKAEGYVATGYQRLLTFETDTPGGFSLFGSPPPKLILTAYGLMEFQDMSEVYNIDEELIPRTQNWILEQQNSDGSWEAKGHLVDFSRDMARSKLTATCLITWSLVNSDYRGNKIDNAVSYIKENINSGTSDEYTLALCANALVEYGRDGKVVESILSKLDETKIEDNDTIHWSSGGESTDRTIMGSKGSIRDIEITALTALAHMKAGKNPGKAVKMLNYLIKQKDSFGTYSSTQATVLSLKALIYAAEHLQQAGSKGVVDVFINDAKASRINIDESNNEVLQLIDLESYTREGLNKVRIEYEGEGLLFYQIAGKYYVPWEKTESTDKIIKIDVEYDTTDIRINDMAEVKVKASYNGVGAANLVIIDLGIPPGFSVVAGDLEELKSMEAVDRYEITGRQLILYVSGISSNKPLEFTYRLKALYPIKAKTPESKVYEYYNPDISDKSKPVNITVYE